MLATKENQAETLYVLKRDGVTRQAFNSQKIYKAIAAAARDAHDDSIISPPGTPGGIDAIVKEVIEYITMPDFKDEPVGVETIQDTIENRLIAHNYADISKTFILFRESRNKARKERLEPDMNALADYIHPSKYSRYIPSLRRREVYEETVERLEDMHIRRFGIDVAPRIKNSFNAVRRKEVLPSMRSMQFGGASAEHNNARIYNCTFSFCDRPRFFSEALWLLLSGCGVGFSVQIEHVEQLPVLKWVDRNKVKHHPIADSIEGWGEAIDRLFDSYIKGYYVEFAYNKIRDKGAPLRLSGGKAPGHMKLKDSIERIRVILDGSQGRQLRPIECYDIMCHIAAAVLSGGIRRSAMICLFSLEDGEMLNAKPAKYWEDHPGRTATPWRGYSNNSVMLKRDEVTKKTFRRIFRMTRQCGEPGFYFCTDFDHGTNPCVEIGLDPKLVITDEIITIMSQWATEAVDGVGLVTGDDQGQVIRERQRHLDWAKRHIGEHKIGWSFCNLSTQNAAKFKSFEDFINAATNATVIGTLQAAYTRFPYLEWVSEIIARRDALLGVSITGIMANPEISLNPDYQKTIAEHCIKVNREIASMIGIRPAARITCVKPEGTGSKELGIPFEGIHPAHARRSLQCILANEDETVFQHFRKINPHMCVKIPDSNMWGVYFPMKAPDSATTRDDVSALEFLKSVLSTQKNWVIPGTARPDQTVGLTHNVSNTVTVRDDEWDNVADFIFEHKEFFTGLSFLPYKGDKEYGPYAPKQSVTDSTEEARWNDLVRNYRRVDYSSMIEEDDNTDLSGEVACAGGACTV